MKILLIGGQSDLACYLYPILSEKHQVITSGRNGCDLYMDLNKNITFPNDIDIVINTVAFFGINTDGDYYNSLEINALGALRICIEAHRKNIKYLLHTSSLSSILPPSSPYYTIYAISKKLGDEIIANYCLKNNIDFAILRPSQLYGYKIKNIHHQPFFHTIICNAAQGKVVQIYGNNDPKRNYLHMEDFANIIDRVIDMKVSGVYTCQYPSNTSFVEIAKTAFEIFGNKTAIDFCREKANIPDNIFMYDDTLYNIIDYFPKISLKMGIEEYKRNREQ